MNRVAEDRKGLAWAKIVALLWTVLLVFGLLTPVFPAVPGLPFLGWTRGIEQPSWFDKLIHAALFLVETRLLARPGVLRPGRRAPRRALIAAFVLSVLTEILQAPIPTRVADWGDFLANLVGIGLAVALGYRAGRNPVGGDEQTR